MQLLLQFPSHGGPEQSGDSLGTVEDGLYLADVARVLLHDGGVGVLGRGGGEEGGLHGRGPWRVVARQVVSLARVG